MLRYILALILLMSPMGSLLALSEECASALKTLFAEEVDAEEAGEFLRLQSDITLHRLAWTYLKAQKDDQDARLRSTENTILDLLDQKYTSSNPEFIKARKAFEEQPLSRAALAEIGPFLKEAMGTEFEEKDRPFRLNASDLKLLAAIARFEKSSAKNGIYDHRMLDAKSPRGMLNFVKLINSSYKLNKTSEESALHIEAKLKGLESLMEGMESRLNEFLNSIVVPPECHQDPVCTSETAMSSFFAQDEEVQKIFWEALAPTLENDDILIERLTYGELWLKVRHKGPAAPRSTSGPARKKSSGQRVRPYSTSLPEADPNLAPVDPTIISDLGLLIEDPVGIIVRDKEGRSRGSWKGMDKDYLAAMAQAVLSDDKVFEHKGKLYDRATGRTLTPEAALAKLTPAKRERFQKMLRPANGPEFLTAQVKAMTNGDTAFTVGEKLYDLDGAKLDPAEVVAQEMSKKFAITISSSRYAGLSEDYNTARALALRNGQPYFKISGKVMDSYTGKSVTSPTRTIAGTSDVKLEKERRRMYEGLSDAELIRNFHRDFPPEDCSHYGVIDKKNAVIKVYANDGTKVYETETLLGTEGSDARTRWVDYQSKTSSKTTGAGMFTIREQDVDDPYNKRMFKNNIISFEGQNTVFAIHQVPVGMKERYTMFGTGDPKDRRGTGGCANVKESDLLAIREWLKPSCKVYVLPEEDRHKFVFRDNALHLISTEPVAAGNERFYNYTPKTKAAAKPIDITFNAAESTISTENNVFTRSFVSGLEEEKAKLMELYGLSNDEYNDLAMLAFGIMGNESEFGKSKKLWLKEFGQNEVKLLKLAKAVLSGEKITKETITTSRGFTQIKYLPEGKFREAYPDIGKGSLLDPRDSAISTVAYLAEAMHTLKRITAGEGKDASKIKITRENMVDYLPYIYMGSSWRLNTDNPEELAIPETNTYIQGIRRNMSVIEITQRIE